MPITTEAIRFWRLRAVDLSTSKRLKAGADTHQPTEPPNADRRVLAVRRFLIQIFTIMSNTFKHKLNTKYRLGLVEKVPISIQKFWDRMNFDKGEFLALRAKKKEQILDNEMNNQLNNEL